MHEVSNTRAGVAFVKKHMSAVVLTVATLSMGAAFSFEAHASRIEWQSTSSAGSTDVVSESAVLFVVGAGLATLATSLRRLIRRSEFEHAPAAIASTAAAIASTGNSRAYALAFFPTGIVFTSAQRRTRGRAPRSCVLLSTDTVRVRRARE